MKKIIKVFFCILTCLIISIPQLYEEESKKTKMKMLKSHWIKKKKKLQKNL